MKNLPELEGSMLEAFADTSLGNLHTIDKDGTVYVPAIETALLLGYKNPRDAIRRHCKHETIAVDGKVGDYIIVARRSGNKWYIGGLTGHQERTVTVDLNFLGEGEWSVELFRDGVNAARHGEDYKKTISPAGKTLTVKMASGGGFAAVLY